MTSPLSTAIAHANETTSALRDALSTASPVEALVLLPLIKQAAELSSAVNALQRAKQEQATC
jgi:hypothetical protein